MVAAEELYALALPQPEEPEDERDWAKSPIYNFISFDHLQ